MTAPDTHPAGSSPDALSPQILEAMFQAVEINDIADPVVTLPDRIPMHYDERAIDRSFLLYRQFWQKWADRKALLRFIHILLIKGDLSAEDRIAYKHIRAAYKQLRFALVLYGRRHRAPPLFRATVALMGLLQDAFRTGRRSSVLRHAMALRLLVSYPSWHLVEREIAGVARDGSADILAFRRAEFDRLQQALQAPAVTSHEFHRIRKIVSRQVSFYDTMRVLTPEDRAAYLMSRFLSAINGQMGRMHDDLIEQAARGELHYRHHRIPLPDTIRNQLEMLVSRVSMLSESERSHR